MLLGETQGCFQLLLGIIKPPKQGQTVSVTAQNLSQPDAAVLELLECLESLFLRIQGCAITPLIFEERSQAIRCHCHTALVPRVTP